MPRATDPAVPPPPDQSRTRADPHAATEDNLGESVEMVSIDTRDLHSTGTIDVDVDEQLFQRNLVVVQPQRPAVHALTDAVNASGSTDPTGAALGSANTQPHRPFAASATDTLNTPLVASTGTINSSSRTDPEALMGIDDLGSTDPRGNVTLTEHMRSANTSFWRPAHERNNFKAKMMALMVFVAGLAAAAFFVNWKSSGEHGARKPHYEPPRSPSCYLRPGQPLAYERLCHGATHNETLCLEMNLTCTWVGPIEPPFSCELKPGQPPGYEPVCHANQNETSCLEMKMTCIWRRGSNDWEQPPPRLFPRLVGPIAQTLSIRPCSFAIAKRGTSWNTTQLTPARWPQLPETAFRLYRPLILRGANCKHVGTGELEDEAGLVQELSIFLNVSNALAPEHYVIQVHAGHAWLTVSAYEGLLQGLRAFSLLAHAPNPHAVDGDLRLLASARVRDGVNV